MPVTLYSSTLTSIGGASGSPMIAQCPQHAVGNGACSMSEVQRFQIIAYIFEVL